MGAGRRLVGDKVGAGRRLVGDKVGAGRRLIGDKVGADRRLVGDKVGADRRLIGEKVGAGRVHPMRVQSPPPNYRFIRAPRKYCAYWSSNKGFKRHGNSVLHS